MNKNINFNKNETESKIENPTSSFKVTNLRKLKVKLWWVGACKRKMRAFLYRLFCPNEIFFNICVLSQCIVYWIHFQNINTFTYQKTLLQTLSLLVFKIVESLQCILKAFLITLFSHVIKSFVIKIAQFLVTKPVKLKWELFHLHQKSNNDCLKYGIRHPSSLTRSAPLHYGITNKTKY